jgi:hypothetical protein
MEGIMLSHLSGTQMGYPGLDGGTLLRSERTQSLIRKM